MSKVKLGIRLADIEPGYAVVKEIVDDGGNCGYVRLVKRGIVYRLGNGKWVPVTRSREPQANWPEYPRYATRRRAAEVLVSGEPVF